jgi:hypothetical protein
MSNLDTLKSAERWIDEALQITAADNPLVFLVGSKQDLIVIKLTVFFLISAYLIILRPMTKRLQKLNKQFV